MVMILVLIIFDCGDEIFDSERQNTYSGGSGCALLVQLYWVHI